MAKPPLEKFVARSCKSLCRSNRDDFVTPGPNRVIHEPPKSLQEEEVYEARMLPPRWTMQMMIVRKMLILDLPRGDADDADDVRVVVGSALVPIEIFESVCDKIVRFAS